MNTTNEVPDSVKIIIPFAEWLDRHPVITNILIAIGVAAMVFVALTYEYTAN